MTNKIIALFFVLTITACKTKAPAGNTTDNNPACNTIATVVDMTGLDGCRYLLEVEGQGKWLPLQTVDPGFKYHAGQKVKFGYEVVDDYISICMAESKGVNITCIEETAAGQNLPKACTEMPHLQKTEWIHQLIQNRQIIKITQHPDDLGYLYYFKSKTKGYLYDCKGTLICDMNLSTESDCSQKVDNLNEGKVILVVNN